MALGVVAGLGASFLVFKWLQSLGKAACSPHTLGMLLCLTPPRLRMAAEPAPRTMNPEWKEAERKRHIEERGANPITNNLYKN